METEEGKYATNLLLWITRFMKVFFIIFSITLLAFVIADYFFYK